MPLSRLACLIALPMLFAAAGCETLGLSDSTSAPPPATRTPGLAVADEPLAAKTGASILTQGGSAADAVTAMFFTLTATYPASAGLGGGGICLTRDARGQVQEFTFLPRRAAGAAAVPGAVRGFYDLQKALGKLPWQRDVAGGESYAATGFPISYAMAQRIVAAQALIARDPALAAEFLDASGRPKPEGSVVTNVALSQVLGAVRLNGADGFYTGAVAAQLAAAGGFTPAELAGYRTVVTAARSVNFGAYTVALPGQQSAAGTFASTLLANMSRAAQSQSPDAAAATAVRQTLAGLGIASLPQDMGATGFAAVDASGQAAACAVTLIGPFGTGHTAPGTGVTLASSPSSPFGYAVSFLTPVLVSDGTNQVALAGAGAGGPNGSAAIEYALVKLAAGQAVNHPGDLRSTGVAPFATVNTISCQNGFCVAIPDPGGHGLGASADEPALPQ